MPGTYIPPSYVISLQELQTSTETKKAKETADFALLKTVPTLPSEELLPKLYEWASEGYPKNFVVKTLAFEYLARLGVQLTLFCFTIIIKWKRLQFKRQKVV